MDSFINNSLHSTLSSIDLGTTFEEPEYFTSTPLKDKILPPGKITNIRGSPLNTPGSPPNTLGAPPPKPDAPKPKTAIRRLTLEEIASFAQNSDIADQKLRIMSFNGHRVELRFDLLQKGHEHLRNRDRKIKRRHTEFYSHEQHPIITTNARASSTGDSDSEAEEMMNVKRLRLSSDNLLSTSCSQTQLCKFRRDSVTRKASHKRTQRSPARGTRVPSLQQLNVSSESAEVNFIQSDRCALIKKPLKKVRKTPSLRLKRFVQKKLKMMLQ